MLAPILLLILSLAGLAAATQLPEYEGYYLLALSSVGASIVLVLGRLFTPRKVPPKPVVVDGSNVMHWRDGMASIEPVREVLRQLKEKGYSAGVVFDANAGYKMYGNFRSHRALSRKLGLSEDRVIVAPKGTPADPLILNAARRMGAKVVTNDRFRDWIEDFPEIEEPGFLIKGGHTRDKIWLAIRDANETSEMEAKTA